MKVTKNHNADMYVFNEYYLSTHTLSNYFDNLHDDTEITSLRFYFNFFISLHMTCHIGNYESIQFVSLMYCLSKFSSVDMESISFKGSGLLGHSVSTYKTKWQDISCYY